MTGRPRPLKRLYLWLSGSISRKLTLFVIFMCLVLIALVWVLGVQLVQPAYNYQIRTELQHSLDTVVRILDECEAEGYPLIESYYNPQTKERENVVSATCVQRLIEAQDEGLINAEAHSIDIAGEDVKNIFPMGRLADSALYPTVGITEEQQRQIDVNSPTVVMLRLELRDKEVLSTMLPSGQLVLGQLAGGGKYTVLAATNLERISQAVNVMRRLMLPVLMALIFVSVLAAALFSDWFTRPLGRLSSAAREMSRGNYDVQVPPQGCDEIAQLSTDFNHMAKDVKRSADLQRDLIANISHDLRTPLTLIKGYAETVRDLTGDDPDKREQQLDVIVDESDRLTQLVGSVMELSRMSSGNEKLERVHFSLTQLCDEVGYRYAELSKKEGHTFHFEGEEPCEIDADPAMIERVLHNLLGNALNHRGEDGYVGLRVFQKGASARVEVADHGPGIAKEDLPYLFDRYYRSREDAGKPGTGLGLSISKAILQAHGFAFGVESELGQGATFWFEAPLVSEQKPT